MTLRKELIRPIRRLYAALISPWNENCARCNLCGAKYVGLALDCWCTDYGE